jgi:hypothetical protein
MNLLRRWSRLGSYFFLYLWSKFHEYLHLSMQLMVSHSHVGGVVPGHSFQWIPFQVRACNVWILSYEMFFQLIWLYTNCNHIGCFLAYLSIWPYNTCIPSVLICYSNHTLETYSCFSSIYDGRGIIRRFLSPPILDSCYAPSLPASPSSGQEASTKLPSINLSGLANVKFLISSSKILMQLLMWW